jgi:hypothetical protein
MTDGELSVGAQGRTKRHSDRHVHPECQWKGKACVIWFYFYQIHLDWKVGRLSACFPCHRGVAVEVN